MPLQNSAGSLYRRLHSRASRADISASVYGGGVHAHMLPQLCFNNFKDVLGKKSASEKHTRLVSRTMMASALYKAGCDFQILNKRPSQSVLRAQHTPPCLCEFESKHVQVLHHALGLDLHQRTHQGGCGWGGGGGGGGW